MSIERHQLNQSPAKARYSFSRSDRFPNPPRSYNPPRHEKIQYNESTSGLSKTGYTFGSGKRSDFTSTPMRTLYSGRNPGPGKYTPTLSLHLKVAKWSFGNETRAACASITDRSLLPGPGTYDSANSATAPKFTMRPKSALLSTAYSGSKDIVPGPGAYDPRGTLADGRVNIAKYRTISCVKWRATASKDRPTTPGPGHYNPPAGLTSTGVYRIAGERSSPAPTFTKQLRRTFSSEAIKKSQETPGPGTYSITSEFGSALPTELYRINRRPVYRQK